MSSYPEALNRYHIFKSLRFNPNGTGKVDWDTCVVSLVFLVRGLIRLHRISPNVRARVGIEALFLFLYRNRMREVVKLAKSFLGNGKRVPCNYCRVMFAQTSVHRHERENCPRNSHRRQKKKRYKYCETCHIFILSKNFSRHT